MTIASYEKCNFKHFTCIGNIGFGPPHVSCSTATFAALQLLTQRNIQELKEKLPFRMCRERHPTFRQLWDNRPVKNIEE